MNNKRILAGIVALTATTLALTGCVGSDAPGPTAKATAAQAKGCSFDDSEGALSKPAGYSGPGTLSISQAFPLNGWDVGLSGTAFAGDYFSTVYDSLFLIDGTCHPYGSVATNVKQSSDGLTYTFDIKKGVKFGDGTTLDAAGVIANLTYLADEKANAAGTAPAYAKVKDMKATGKYSVEIQMSTYDPVFLYNLGLGNSYLTNPKKLDASDGYAEYKKAAVPDGSGPYVLDAADTTGSIAAGSGKWVFTKSKTSSSAKYYPWKEVDISVFQDPTGQASEAAAVNGTVNVLYSSYSQQLKSDAQANGWSLVKDFSGWSGYEIADRTGKTNPCLADAKVRQAMNWAIPRADLLKGEDAATAGYEVQSVSVFAQSTQAADTFGTNGDVAKAKELLSQASDPSCQKGFILKVPSSAFFDLTSFKQYMAKIGITVKIDKYDANTYNQQVFSGNYGVFAAFLQLYGNPGKTVQDYFAPGGYSNPLVKTDSDLEPAMKSLIAKFYSPGSDVEALADQIDDYAVKNGYFIVTSHGADAFALAKGITMVPVEGLYIPNLQQFLPDAK